MVIWSLAISFVERYVVISVVVLPADRLPGHGSRVRFALRPFVASPL